MRQSYQPLIAYRPREKTNRMIVHGARTKPDIKSWPEWLAAQGRRMGLLEVGYHYAIDRAGLPVYFRHVTVQGSHTPGYNEDSIGVLLLGGLDEDGNEVDNFTVDQVATLIWLFRDASTQWPGLRLDGHSELPRYRTTKRKFRCPNINMDWVRLEAAAYSSKENPVTTKPLENHKTQKQIILDYLRGGDSPRTLTQMVALTCLGIGSLTSRIAELRLDGHKIKGEWARDNFDRQYMKYTLDQSAAVKGRDEGFGRVPEDVQ